MTVFPGRGDIGQIGIVVKELETAMEAFWRTSGIGPWSVYTAGAPPLRCTYHNHPANYRVRLATARSGPVVMELIQYLSGETIHGDFFNSGRVGVEHVGIYVSNLQEALKPYIENGIGILQSAEGMGLKGDGCYAYLDTESIMGTILELIQSSSQPVPPESVYPAIR